MDPDKLADAIVALATAIQNLATIYARDFEAKQNYFRKQKLAKRRRGGD